jgi:SAM-dependent methyltransferase
VDPPFDSICPACDCASVRCLGGLPEGGDDGWSTASASSGWLFSCLQCTLRFRLPVPAATAILGHYALRSAAAYAADACRPVWHYVRQVLSDAPKRSLLDVGCSRGDLLDWLGPEWDRYGIEPSRDARAVVEARGIELLGWAIEDPGLRLPSLGAVTLIDVLEHLPRPANALHRLSDALVPGGRLVVFTGDTDALSWRLSGNDYWYSALSEHVSFFSRSWFEWAAPRCSCTLGRIRRLSHDPVSAPRRLVECLQNLTFLAYRRLGSLPGVASILARTPWVRRMGRHRLAWWTSAKDHILVELVKA